MPGQRPGSAPPPPRGWRPLPPTDKSPVCFLASSWARDGPVAGGQASPRRLLALSRPRGSGSLERRASLYLGGPSPPSAMTGCVCAWPWLSFWQREIKAARSRRDQPGGPFCVGVGKVRHWGGHGLTPAAGRGPGGRGCARHGAPAPQAPLSGSSLARRAGVMTCA